jgi:hypothetical protein
MLIRISKGFDIVKIVIPTTAEQGFFILVSSIGCGIVTIGSSISAIAFIWW